MATKNGHLPSAAVRGPGHATLKDDEMLVSKRTVPLGAQADEVCTLYAGVLGVAA